MIKQKYFQDETVIVHSLCETGVDLQPGQVATGGGETAGKSEATPAPSKNIDLEMKQLQCKLKVTEQIIQC